MLSWREVWARDHVRAAAIAAGAARLPPVVRIWLEAERRGTAHPSAPEVCLPVIVSLPRSTNL
ncbi:MAG: hypothetical protein QOH47_849 [Sphingomonadales bacterium]|jgi:hypothetical protein|nr:hypothetical protein [Sphingomonadales bacterium]